MTQFAFRTTFCPVTSHQETKPANFWVWTDLGAVGKMLPKEWFTNRLVCLIIQGFCWWGSAWPCLVGFGSMLPQCEEAPKSLASHQLPPSSCFLSPVQRPIRKGCAAGWYWDTGDPCHCSASLTLSLWEKGEQEQLSSAVRLRMRSERKQPRDVERTATLSLFLPSH